MSNICAKIMSNIRTTLFGSADDLPSNLNNPFDSTKVEGITIYTYKSCFSKTFTICGKVEFKNGRTEGTQKFEGETIIDVVQQIYKFLEQL